MTGVPHSPQNFAVALSSALQLVQCLAMGVRHPGHPGSGITGAPASGSPGTIPSLARPAPDRFCLVYPCTPSGRVA